MVNTSFTKTIQTCCNKHSESDSAAIMYSQNRNSKAAAARIDAQQQAISISGFGLVALLISLLSASALLGLISP